VTDIPKMSQDDIDVMQGPLPVDMSGEGDKPVIRQFRDHHFGHLGEAGKIEADEEFFSDVVEGVVSNQADMMCLHLLLLTNMSPSPLTFLKAAKSPAL